MGNVELRLYRYFVTLCEERNFARASERLGISPPTLTHQIQKLEKDLEVRLLNRKTKRAIQLTQAGSRFLESARNVLHQADEAELTARKAARGEIGRVEVGYVIAALYSGLLQRLIGSFQKAYPAVDVTLHQLSTVGQVGSIASNKLDAGFARLPKQFPAGLSGFPVYRQSVILALPSSHPLARKRDLIDPKSLINETFVSTSIEFDLAFKRDVECVGSQAGFTPTVRKRAENLTTVLAYVSAGYGIAALSQDLENCRVPNVVFKKIAWNDAPQLAVAFMYRTNETAPASKALIEAMRAHALKLEDVESGY